MPTQKIDPKVIFASDAPAIDKPPVFSDKTKGWDVARANDGRPEIKQMNKIQQDTDLKILWLNENAVAPYDSTIDYPEDAVTLKDGSFKQLKSGSWVDFIKPVSEISSDKVKDDSGLTQQEVTDVTLFKPIEYFGAKGGYVNDQGVISSLGNNYSYILGKTYNIPCWNSQGTKFYGNGTTINVNAGTGLSTVAVQIRDNSFYRDISFVNNRTVLKEWTYSVVGNNSVFENVGFYNFDDNSNPKKSWGVLIGERKNIIFNQCHFGGNGVSDIAIVDKVYNVKMINLSNATDGGVYLDIEPNQTSKDKSNVVSGITVDGGHYRHISVLENSFTNYGIGDININASVDMLELRGGVVNVSGVGLKGIKGNWYPSKDFQGFQNEYFSQLKIDNAQLGENLIKDPQLFDMTLGSTTSYWSIYAPQNMSINRVNNSRGVFLSINNSKQYSHRLSTRDFIDIPVGTTHLCTMISHGVSNGSDSNFNTVFIEFYNQSNVLIETLSYKGCRVDSNLNLGLACEQGVFRLPANFSASKFKIRLECKTQAEYLIARVGVFPFSLVSSFGNFNVISGEFSKPQSNLNYTAKIAPLDLRATTDRQTLTTSSGEVYRVLSGKLVKISSPKLYFSTTSQSIVIGSGATSPTSMIMDITVTGVKMGQSVMVSSVTRLGNSVSISATVTDDNIVRLLVVNFGVQINTQSVFNFIVE